MVEEVIMRIECSLWAMWRVCGWMNRLIERESKVACKCASRLGHCGDGEGKRFNSLFGMSFDVGGEWKVSGRVGWQMIEV